MRFRRREEQNAWKSRSKEKCRSNGPAGVRSREAGNIRAAIEVAIWRTHRGRVEETHREPESAINFNILSIDNGRARPQSQPHTQIMVTFRACSIIFDYFIGLASSSSSPALLPALTSPRLLPYLRSSLHGILILVKYWFLAYRIFNIWPQFRPRMLMKAFACREEAGKKFNVQTRRRRKCRRN